MNEQYVLCNLCGHLCALADEAGAINDQRAGLQNAVVSGGYHSTAGNGDGALDDTTSYRFSLCEFCLDWLFSKFTVPVQVSCYMGGAGPDEEPEQFIPAAQRVKEDEWRRFKKEFFAEHDKRAKAREEKK
jgi:hypothetical protein